jgi:uncharacterized membrane protein
MVDSRLKPSAAPRNSPSDEDLDAQLAESRKLREHATQVTERADKTASEMSSVLRRLALALDRNPQTWDALFYEESK